MALLKPSLPDVHDMAEWQTRTRRQRMQVTSRHWVDHGFGSPLLAYGFYLLKLVVYVGGAILLIPATTPGIGGVTDIASWWTEGIVYQKLIVWTLLYEIIGLGCGSGPMTSRFMPPIGSVLYWLRPGTIRLPVARHGPVHRGLASHRGRRRPVRAGAGLSDLSPRPAG